ncbi:16S rRNA (guanine(966)-N(2))-methyltransferase RsmD [Aquisalimonas asiatica]|uniref:Ribosomal RNA small subunit methyltransferase D n=1 Tax=Aquisalimonas asiatica TaxID=406100 RepID=A0A1H8VFQ8_9GAMM|nr:16S rRNA (guanine(966)-N(2))-methyltransferase RsmD [Aquisalimonas asiatica]SEP14292.1 16S rRNA (guanine966-N2)-methyltransferase [Aquisalimonas asiatica]
MARRARNELRIIGGEWRGRRLRFAGGAGLRPTADRNRETLFNWLQPLLPGSRCLDVFAGSGALGFEAASRGAAEVVLVERDRRALAALRENIRLLAAADQVSVHGGDALTLLAGGAPRPFDVIFLDPPFRESLLEPACQALAESGWCHGDTRIYMEHARQQAPALPAHWQVLRERTAGDVHFLLLQATGN